MSLYSATDASKLNPFVFEMKLAKRAFFRGGFSAFSTLKAMPGSAKKFTLVYFISGMKK